MNWLISFQCRIKPITSNPAKILKLETKGHIAEGYDADFCFLTDDLVMTFLIVPFRFRLPAKRRARR